MWVWDSENKRMVHREIKYVPGFFKIIDEILVNAADNKVSSVHFACGSRDFFLGGGGLYLTSCSTWGNSWVTTFESDRNRPFLSCRS